MMLYTMMRFILQYTHHGIYSVIYYVVYIEALYFKAINKKVTAVKPTLMLHLHLSETFF